ncbi:hypothetical protein [Leifsonia xyli]|uniref:hypothetical protein n=1 Tax=Leifsonia xyli TaxID=1575 RepID=UPI003D6683E5
MTNTRTPDDPIFRTQGVLVPAERAPRPENDTVFAIAAALVGATCVIVCAIGVIALCIAPLGAVAVVIAAVGAGALATVLLAGGVWAWRTDRWGRGL